MRTALYQTRETVFHRDSQTPRRELKIDQALRSIFDEIGCVWIADETLSREFDLSSQSKQKLRSERRKLPKSMLIKTWYLNLLPGYDFLELLNEFDS